jgi:putative ABC transport system permease protein
MTGAILELRSAARLWARRPFTALTSALTLGLTIGAVVAVSALSRRLILEPLPYRDPERLVAVYSRFPSLDFDRFWLSGPEVVELAEWSTSYAGVAAWVLDSVDVLGESPVRARLAATNAASWSVWGVDAQLGRTFTATEDMPGAAPVTVLAHDFWQRAFAADPAIVGRGIRMDGRTVTIVGVMPRGFDLLREGVDLWVPLALDPTDPGPRPAHFLTVAARLAPDANVASANTELSDLMARWQRVLGDQHAPHPDKHAVFVTPLHRDLVAELLPSLGVLATASLLLLAIGTVNLLGLRLADLAVRRRDTAARLALGARRRGLATPFLAEALWIALPACLVALVVAWAAAPVAAAAFPVPEIDQKPQLVEGALAAGLALLLAVGALTPWPWLLTPRGQLTGSPAARVGNDLRASRTFRAALALQVALATALVAGAGVAVQRLADVTPDEPGYRPERLLTLELALPEAGYPEAHQVEAFYARLLERLRALPGVVSAATGSALPPERVRTGNNALFETLDLPPDAPPASIAYTDLVSPEWLDTFGIQLVRGEGFRPEDAAAARPVAIISRSTAAAFWRDRDPLGDRFREGLPNDPEPTWFTIVGIVEGLAPPPGDDPGLEAYFLAGSSPQIFGTPLRDRFVVVRSEGDPAALAPAVRGEIARLDPALAVAAMRSMDEVIGESLRRPRLVAAVTACCAGLALALALLGLHAALRQSLALRRQEMAVRAALGATRTRLARALLGAPLAWCAAGLAAGVLLGLTAHRASTVVATDLPAVPLWTLAVGVGLVAAAIASAAAASLPGLRNVEAASELRKD